MKINVSPGVIILACFSGAILLVTSSYYVSLLVRLGRYGVGICGRRKNQAANMNLVPDSTLAWMLHASRERGLEAGTWNESSHLIDVPNNEEDLRNWSFVMVDAGQGVARIMRTTALTDSGSTSAEQIHLSEAGTKV